MNEQSLLRFEFSEEFKQKLVELVIYKNVSAAQVAKKYDFPNPHILINWINNYKRKLEKGAVTLAPMEKANVLIYGLNAMIDHAERESKVPIRKKGGTKQ